MRDLEFDLSKSQTQIYWTGAVKFPIYIYHFRFLLGFNSIACPNLVPLQEISLQILYKNTHPRFSPYKSHTWSNLINVKSDHPHMISY